MKISARASSNIQALNLICMAFVVLVHCYSIPFVWFKTGENCGFSWHEALVQFAIVHGLGQLAVPFFLTVSGYFMVKGFDGSFAWWKKTCIKRLWTIYVPLIVWNIITAVESFISGSGPSVLNMNVVNSIIGINPFSRLACIQMWYLQAIIVYVLSIMPMCILMTRFRLGLVILGIMYFSWVASVPTLPSIIFLWQNVFFFFAGVWLYFNFELLMRRWACLARLFKLAPVGFIVALLIFVAAGFAHCWLLYNKTFCVLLPLGLLTVYRMIGACDFIKRVLVPFRGLSFFVYAVHLIVMKYVVIWLDQCLGLSHGNELFVALRFVLTLGGSLAIAIVVRKLLPHFYAVATGGRSR